MVKRYTYLEVNCEEYFFKTKPNLRKLFDTDNWEQMEFKKDKKRFRNDLQSCKDKDEVLALINVTLNYWKGNKIDWVLYTKMAVNPHKNFILKDYFYDVLNKIQSFLLQNEYDFIKINRLF